MRVYINFLSFLEKMKVSLIFKKKKKLLAIDVNAQASQAVGKRGLCFDIGLFENFYQLEYLFKILPSDLPKKSQLNTAGTGLLLMRPKRDILNISTL